jgi:multicomponent K+:H+ antiporter subunit A
LNAPLPEYHLAIWHGLNVPLLMSVIGLVGGIALWAFLHRIGALRADPRVSLGKRLFEMGVEALVAVAAGITRLLESGRLPAYLAWTVAATIAAGAVAFAGESAFGDRGTLPAAPGAWVLWLVVVVGTLAVALGFRQRVLAVLVVGAIGLAVSLAFVFLSAPDLALTQLMVETLSILLILLALRYLPQASPPERAPWQKGGHAVLAVTGGAVIGGLAYAMMTQPVASISEYFLRTSQSEGGGLNVVNVIIVDYRALDTLGEITVVGIAALIIAALLRNARPQPEGLVPASPAAPSLMLQLVAQWLLPLGLAVSLYFFLRGHNAPGGGFIAALVLVAAVFLQALGGGRALAERQFRNDWTAWIGVGLLVATVTGLGAFAFGHPFLTSSTPYVELPIPMVGEWLGKVPFASAMGFDTGVYVTVAGALLLVLVLLTRLHRPEGQR